jgi:hypothetical protein
MSDSSSAIVRPVIYREYIVKDLPTGVNPEYNPVDFIIGFASEDYNPSGRGTGHFHHTWNLDTFSPEKVKQLKEDYPNVRVVISIGGVDTIYPFNPDDKHVWIATAVKSINRIIHIYDDNNHKNLIDGIDIHYEAIKSSPEDFSYCIGQVIKKLKIDPLLSIKVVSVAPTDYTQSYYVKLVSENQNYIDFVDYLFTNQRFPTIKDFVTFYENLVAEYSPVPVLPGFLNSGFYNKIPEEAIVYLIKHKIAPGFFTYPSQESPGPVTN